MVALYMHQHHHYSLSTDFTSPRNIKRYQMHSNSPLVFLSIWLHKFPKLNQWDLRLWQEGLSVKIVILFFHISMSMANCKYVHWKSASICLKSMTFAENFRFSTEMTINDLKFISNLRYFKILDLCSLINPNSFNNSPSGPISTEQLQTWKWKKKRLNCK